MNLMFWRPGSSEILDSKYADVDRGIAWGESELAGTLVGRPLSSVTTGNGVDASYVSQNLRSEAHLYARDPHEITETLTEHASSGLLQLPGIWEALTPPGALPRSVVLTANRFTESNKRPLSTVDFFSNVPPEGPAASPPGGSVKAVRVYNHGACSHETLTSQSDGKGLLDEVSEAVWKGFVEGVIVDGGECKNNRHPFLLSSAAVNYLDHTPRETRDLRGGFFLHVKYFADLPLTPPVPNIHTTFTVQYQYALIDGILGLAGARTFQNTTGPSWVDTGEMIKDGLRNKAPAKFAELGGCPASC